MNMSQHSKIGAATNYKLDNNGLIFSRGTRFFFVPKHPD